MSWITRRSAILLLLLGLAVGPAAARPGDVAPPGAPDGRLTVEDALLTLRMTVGLEPIRGGAETAPFVPFGPHSMVVPDGRVDVADTLSTLRGVVGLHDPALLGDAQGSHEDVVRDAMRGLEALVGLLDAQGGWDHESMGGMMQWREDCVEGGSVGAGSGAMGPASGEHGDHQMQFDSCDTGPCVVDGEAEVHGPDDEGFTHHVVDLHVEHDEHGTMRVRGEHERREGVAVGSEALGAHLRGRLTVTSPSLAEGECEYVFDLVRPDDGGRLLGECYWLQSEGPAIRVILEEGATARVTVLERRGRSEHALDRDDGTLTPSP